MVPDEKQSEDQTQSMVGDAQATVPRAFPRRRPPPPSSFSIRAKLLCERLPEGELRERAQDHLDHLKANRLPIPWDDLFNNALDVLLAAFGCSRSELGGLAAEAAAPVVHDPSPTSLPTQSAAPLPRSSGNVGINQSRPFGDAFDGVSFQRLAARALHGAGLDQQWVLRSGTSVVEVEAKGLTDLKDRSDEPDDREQTSGPKQKSRTPVGRLLETEAVAAPRTWF